MQEEIPLNLDPEDLLAVYMDFDRIDGPVLMKDGRKRLILHNVDSPYGQPGRSKILSYPKALVESVIGRQLHPNNETVDHKDEDFTNDSWDNLQLLTRAENARKSAIGNKHCVGFKQSDEQARRGEKNGMAELTNETVAQYRQLFSEKRIDKKSIMAEVDLDRRSVENFLRGISYKQAAGPVCEQTGKVGRPPKLKS